jgi:RNA polymerase sigma-70 factor (sigma-E family)
VTARHPLGVPGRRALRDGARGSPPPRQPEPPPGVLSPVTAQSAVPPGVGSYPSLAALERDDAVAALFRLHHRRLVGLARLLVGDRASAEDVVQDAFVALYKRWRWLRDKDAAVGYLDQAVLNSARSLLRKRKVRSAVRWLPQPEATASAETEVVAGDEARRVVAALDQLSDRQREVIVLRYFLDRSEAEIAEALGISAGSVKQHASRGLAALARAEGLS